LRAIIRTREQIPLALPRPVVPRDWRWTVKRRLVGTGSLVRR